MCKFESQVQVIRVLKNEKVSNVPSIRAITKLYNKFLEFGTVFDLPRIVRPKISDEMSTESIRAIFEENPKSTLIPVSMQTGLSGVTVYRRISSDIGMFPYKIEIDQQLHKDDFEKWFEMAEQLIPILQDPVWDKKLYCSDESTFYISVQINKHNCHI